jgi:hypothetical protein
VIGSNEASRAASVLRKVSVPRSAARVMAACATAPDLCPELPLLDGLARAAFERLGGNLADFNQVELRSTAWRTFVVDCLARDFSARAPDGLGVGMWSLLSTRGHRLVDMPWVDVDAPDVAKLREFVLPARCGWAQVATCLCDPSWFDAVCEGRARKALFVLDESVLPMAAGALTLVLDQISERAASGSELLLAFDASAPVRPASPHSGAALEMVSREASGSELTARYPRLRFIDSDVYAGGFGVRLAGLPALPTLPSLQAGVAAPALAHLRII